MKRFDDFKLNKAFTPTSDRFKSFPTKNNTGPNFDLTVTPSKIKVIDTMPGAPNWGQLKPNRFFPDGKVPALGPDPNYNGHGIDVQKQYGDAFNNIQPAAQEILARQNHEPWDNPCLSTVVHMINKPNPFAFYQFQEHLEHRFDHPVNYSYTLDVSNFPALSGITKCGDHVTSNIAHWINLKSTGQLGKNVGNKVFSNFNTMKFNHNNIGDDAVEPILNSLSYQTLNLTTLKLCHNHLGDGFVKLFLNATSKDNGRAEHSIKNIVLHHNFIGDDGAKMFADALKSGQLPNTKYIDVSGNNITKDGYKSLMTGLESPKVKSMMVTLIQNQINFHDKANKAFKTTVDFVTKGLKYAIDEHYKDNIIGTKWDTNTVRTDSMDKWKNCKEVGLNVNIAITGGLIKCSATKNPQAMFICVSKDVGVALLDPDTLWCAVEINEFIDETKQIIGDYFES